MCNFRTKLKHILTSQKFYRNLRDYSSAVIASIVAANIVLWRLVLQKNPLIGIVAIILIFVFPFLLYAYLYNRSDRVVNKKLKIPPHRLYIFNRNTRLLKRYFIQVELGIIAAGLYAISLGSSVVYSALFSAIFAIIGFFAIYLTIVFLDWLHSRKIISLKVGV